METQYVINITFSIIGAGVAWWVKTIWEMLKSQQEQISALSMKMVESYVPRAELEKTFSRIFDTLEKINEQLTHVRNNQAQVRAMQDALEKLRGGGK